MELTLCEEQKLSEAVVELHPHKELIKSWRPRFFVIRKGWGFLRKKLEKADKENVCN